MSMIDAASQQLEQWICKTLGLASVSFAPPGATKGKAGISCYLLELVENPPLRGARRAPLQLALHYLVTSWADSHEASQRLLGDLIFAAMEHEEYEVLLRPLPAEMWRALGTVPQPCFLLRVLVRVDREERRVPRVREPVAIDGAPVVQLHGIVLGPGDIPISGAQVELPALQRVTRTDSQGRFRINGVAPEPRVKQLRIRAKGETLDISVEQPALAEEPVLIHFDLLD